MLDRIGRLRQEATVTLNIGCGSSRLEGAINIDLHGSPDVCADARNLPFPDNFADLVESHHMLEHFDLNDGKIVMDEWARVTKSGGKLVVTVPDLLGLHAMMNNTKDIPEVWQSLVRFFYGENSEGMRHLSGYTPKFLTYRLQERGFFCEVIPWPYRPTPSFGVIACKA